MSELPELPRRALEALPGDSTHREIGLVAKTLLQSGDEEVLRLLRTKRRGKPSTSRHRNNSSSSWSWAGWSSGPRGRLAARFSREHLPDPERWLAPAPGPSTPAGESVPKARH